MSDVIKLLQQVLDRWRSDDIPIPSGVDPTQLIDFESHYGVVFPSDMREFYLTVNGMGEHYDEENFFRIWPLEDLRSVEEHSPEVTAAFPESKGYYFFFDHSIEVFLYAIRLNASKDLDTPIALVHPQSPATSPSFDLAFESFSQFLSLYASDPEKLF